MATDIERLLREIRSLPAEDQKRVRAALDRGIAPQVDERPTSEVELQRRLVEAGLLKEIKRPRRDPGPFKRRTPVEIKGKPLSETIIEGRR